MDGSTNRRAFLGHLAAGVTGALGAAALPPAIQRALAIPADRRSGTLADVAHVVVLTQENRSFDHYFGTLPGVRGFGDRFPIPVPDTAGRRDATVFCQSNGAERAEQPFVAPFHLDTQRDFATMRLAGTPHSFPDAQAAWADGKLEAWPKHKHDHAMGYFKRADIPFQFALAEAFTICDAYHCALHAGTNPNRLFLWTGSNDPSAAGGGPVVDNSYDHVEHDPDGGYVWRTYVERLQAAGVTWRVYQDMADNFTDNPLAGFRSFRAAYRGEPGANDALRERGLSTRSLAQLREDVIDGTLPQVSYIVATAEGSEHPGPASPAQGAAYTARVLEALTANPDVWARTVLFVNFDENDGFFDHVPPPAPPSYARRADGTRTAALLGASTLDTDGEYHVHGADDAHARTPYGLGPRVPMYVVSPWSAGGWVSSEVFDHTSVIRFLERRFGVHEPNISAWRRGVCGDLTSAFDFTLGDEQPFFEALPDTSASRERARALRDHKTPALPVHAERPRQAHGVRPSRPVPYALHVHAHGTADGGALQLTFHNTGSAAAVFHVYDRNDLERGPRRYTVGAGAELVGRWESVLGAYDLWVLGPNGFHRHFSAVAGTERVLPALRVGYRPAHGELALWLRNPDPAPRLVTLTANAYLPHAPRLIELGPRGTSEVRLELAASALWYDFTVRAPALPGYALRFAGRLETGRPGYSDPALGGAARFER